MKHTGNHYKNISSHIIKHHKKYLLGTFGSFAIIKTIILFAGFLGNLMLINNATNANFTNPSTTCVGVTQIPQSECTALLNFYNETNGDSRTTKTNWGNINTINNRYGITLSGGHVSELFFQGNNLSGNISTFSGFPSLEKISLSSNHISSIGNGAFSGLSNLDYIVLTNNGLTDIPNLGGLSKLQYLYLGMNQLTDIPNLNGLTNLLSFDMTTNHLTSIPNDAFTGLINLRSIALNENQITSLPANIFKGLSSLRSISLDHNEISVIPDHTFDGLTNLQRIYINSNHIADIPNNIFSGLSSLNELELNTNQITSIPDHTFDGLTNLQRISLGANQLSSLPSDIFQGLSNLVVIVLSQNQLTTVPNLSGLSNLAGLNMHSNNIASIPNHVFDGLTSLQDLYLNENQLTSFPSNILLNMPNLQTIEVAINHISSIPEELTGLTHLVYINPSSNNIHIGSMSPALIAFINLKSQGTNRQNTQGINNTPPVASGNTFTTEENTTLSVSAASGVLSPNQAYDTQGDTMNVRMKNIPVHGILTMNTGNGGFVYVPDQYFNGTDYFTYYLYDGPTTGNIATGTIIVNSGATSDAVIIPADTSNQNNIINEFETNGYQNATGAIDQVSAGTYVGGKRIKTALSNGKILVPFVLKSSGPNQIELKAPSGLVMKKGDGSAFLGILNPPLLKSTAITEQAGLSNITTVADFGNSENVPIYFKDNGGNPEYVELRIPVPNGNIGDPMIIYYSHDGYDWTPSGVANIRDISGSPYIYITTDHATMFAIGSLTGSFVINNDAATTATNSVTLNINLPFATNMRFSDDNSTRSSREPYVSAKSRTLPGTYGVKTVYAQFDTDNNTSTVEASTSDSIQYYSSTWSCSSPGAGQGCISLEIVANGYGYCEYGNSLDLGITGYSSSIRDISSPFLTTSGNTTWLCNDLQGAAPWTLSIASSDLLNMTTNNSVHTISGSKVFISNPVAVKTSGVCTANSGSSQGSWINIGTDTVILGKYSSTGEVCQIETSGVDLKVEIPAYQALGQYSGTLTITVPNL